MKNIKTHVLALILGMTLFTGLAKASDQTDRKGFFLDIAPLFGYESQLFEEFGWGGALQLGAGLNENLILMASSQVFMTEVDSVSLSIAQFLVKAQYFPMEDSDFYVAGGIGFARVEASADFGGTTFSVESNSGFTANLGAGYQFRTGQKFYLAPEFLIDYSRIEGEDLLSTSGALRLGWYF